MSRFDIVLIIKIHLFIRRLSWHSRSLYNTLKNTNEVKKHTKNENRVSSGKLNVVGLFRQEGFEAGFKVLLQKMLAPASLK